MQRSEARAQGSQLLSQLRRWDLLPRWAWSSSSTPRRLQLPTFPSARQLSPRKDKVAVLTKRRPRLARGPM